MTWGGATRAERRIHRTLAVWAVLLAIFLLVLPLAALLDSAVGAIAASLVVCGYGLAVCRMAWLMAEDDARRADEEGRADHGTTLGGTVWAFVAPALVLLFFSVFPFAAARHRLPGRGGGDGTDLDFGDAAPALLATAQALGWLAAAMVLLGAPLAAWVATRSVRSERSG